MNKKGKGAVLCPNCRKLVSADEVRCPHCGHSNPGSGWKQNLSRFGRNQEDRFVSAVIWVNVGVFVISILLNPRQIGMSFNPLYMLSPSNQSLIWLGATGTLPIDQFGRWWSLLAANYLHGGILHLLFNIFAFKQISPLIIREFGLYRTISIFTLGGVIGFVASYLAGVYITIGASAAICGLIGAAFFFGYHRGGVYGQMVFRQIGGWIIGLFIFGFLIPGINNWGHGGGLLAGVVLALALGYQERSSESFFHKILAGICVTATILALTWALVTSIVFRMFS